MTLWLESSRNAVMTFAAVGICLLVVGRLAYLAIHPPRSSRRTRKLLLRALFAVSLLLLFVNPLLVRETRRHEALLMIRDDSPSMRRPLGGGNDVDAIARRDAQILLRSARQKNVDAAEITFSALTADALQSRRLLLLSDGQPVPGSVAELLEGHTPDRILVGSALSARNWALDAPGGTPLRNVKGKNQTVDVLLRLTGAQTDDDPRRACLDLWARDDDGALRFLSSETIALPADVDALPVSAPIPSDAIAPDDDALLLLLHDADAANASPEERFQRTAARLDDPDQPLRAVDELNLADNGLLVDLKARRLRVLLADDRPRDDYRYLRETLRREQGVELRTLLYAADPLARDADPLALDPGTLDRRTLADFDVVILGDLTHDQLRGRLAKLVEVVEREGSKTSVWFLGTRRAGDSPFARLLPGERLPEPDAANDDDDGDARVSVVLERAAQSVWTNSGDLHSPDFNLLPPLFRPRPGAASIMTARAQNANGNDDARPLCVVDPRGSNAVAWFGADELWRFQTLEDKNVYRSVVMQLLEYLADARPAGNTSVADSPDALYGADHDPDKAADSADSDLFQFFRNNNPRRIALLREFKPANATDLDVSGATLDLRLSAKASPRDHEPPLVDFLAQTLREAPLVATTEKSPLVPENYIYPLVILLFLLVILC